MAFIPAHHAEANLARRPEDREPLVGSFVADYLVVARLGRGTFGRVLLGLQRPRFRLRAALKLLDFEPPDAWSERKVAQQIEREAEALSLLDSPNVVRLLQHGTHDGQAFLAMEHVAGGRTVEAALAEAAETGQRLPSEALGRIIEHTANGLEAAHAEGLIHRDIKPANLMLQAVVDDPWFVKIVDFGLARMIAGTGRSTAVGGTLQYMAPEQLDGVGLGPPTDLYALGVVAFELMTGRCPFDARTDRLLAEKRDPGFDPVASTDVDATAAAFFRTALHIDPTRRFQHARALREAWRDVLAGRAGG
jgi:serine/threonine-protein kinase